MNDDLFMNDTFDNFVFTQTEILFTKPKDKSTPIRRNSIISCESSVKSELENVSTKNDISLDDSIFLTQSESFSSPVLQKSNEKKEKETTKHVLKENNSYISKSKAKIKRTNSINMEVLGSCKCDKDSVKENAQSNKSEDDNGAEYITSDLKKKLYISTDSVQIDANGISNKNRHINKVVSNLANQEKSMSIRNINLIKTHDTKGCGGSEDIINEESKPEMCKLSSWGLPPAVLQKYESRNIKNMFPWQVECLSNVNILNECKNLVYSAPTSSGKTLVAEILAIKTVFERKKKVIFILPFVSIVREKMYYFQDILGSSGIRVEGFMGSYNPPGGFTSVQVAICTIEKANSLINRLLEEGKLCDIGAILVDEVHLLGDPSRGYLLELLLTKLRYISKKDENVKIQVVGMSATLPNLPYLAKWLDAELYTTNFRPIPLYEQAHVCGEIYDNNLKLVRKISPLPELGTDTDNILQLCLETIKESCSVLIFCPTKNWCENLSQQIATAFCKIGRSNSTWSGLLRSQLNTNLIMEVLGQLRYCPVGLDSVLRKTVSFGVAFHHAGLTMDERDIIEGAFRNGALRVLVATSTLSSGVNLPARRVIIRTPNFHGKPIDTLTYRQMIGRAGRMGKDAVGESVLICQKNDYKIAKQLMSAELTPVESCLEGAGKLKRAILEVIASGVASSPEDVSLFTKCTLLAVEEKHHEDLENPIEEAVNFLKNNEFIRLQTHKDGSERYAATSLGKACLSSSIAPDEGLALFTELEKARQCFVLETELHLIYLVTPYSACNSWGNIDWMFYLELWERLPSSMKKVGELVGVHESYIVNATRGKIQTSTNKLYHKLLVHKRFFVALALQDLVNEKPLGEVCVKFNCNRGMLQSLQQSSSSFAGMVTSFSRQLGWSSVEILISQFQDRMQFGVGRDLLDLMRLPILNGKMARILYNAGIETVIQLANSELVLVEDILHRVVPFETEKGRDGESDFEKKQRNKFRNIWVTGKEGLTEREAAEMLVADARRYLKLEMGVADAKWGTDGGCSISICSEQSQIIDSVAVQHKSDQRKINTEGNGMLKGAKKSSPLFNNLQNNMNILQKSYDSDEVCSNSDSHDLNTSSIISEEGIANIEDAPEKNNKESVERGIENIEDALEKNNNGSAEHLIANIGYVLEKNKGSVEHAIVEKIKSTLNIYDTEKTIKKIDTTNKSKENHCSSPKENPKLSLTNNQTKMNLRSNSTQNKNANIEANALSCFRNSDNSEKLQNFEPTCNVKLEENNFSSSSGSSTIKNTKIEDSVPKSANLNRSWIRNATFTSSKSFKVPQSTKNEVSQLFMSPSEVELNISDSSVFSSHSNVNMSVESIKSDQSLFNESFTLHLSDSDKESVKEGGVEAQNKENINLSDEGRLLEIVFSESFNVEQDQPDDLNVSDDILASSLSDEMPNISRKRKNNSDQCSTTPSKKIRSFKEKKESVQKNESVELSHEQLHASYVQSKLQEEEAADFSKLDIINVCKHTSLLELFNKECVQQKHISLSLACSKVAEKRSLIGTNIIKQEVDNAHTEQQGKFCYKGRRLDGFAVTWDGRTVFYLPLADPEYHSGVLKILKSVLANRNLQVRMFDSKEQLKVLYYCCAINFKGKIDDPKVADWILDPEDKEKNLQAMAVKYCPEAVKLSQLAGGCKGVGSVALDLHSAIDPKIRSAVEAVVTWHLVYALKPVLRDTNPDYLKIYDVENDTILCLAKMEINGLSVRREKLQDLVDALKNQMTLIERRAFCLAGRKFNFVSSTEVAKAVGMFRGRKVSTRKQVLEQSEHPISDLVLQWRKLNCTLTKTIYPLIRLAEDQHIHGCYITHTATGRITMHEPNLQNIAKDFDVTNPLTKEKVKLSCRSAFQVPDNFCLVSADYCQLELRILAHLSQDVLLCGIMRKPGDVFRSIAAKWNKVEEDKVDESMRQNAKHLCYGIIYGMGSKTLAEQLLITEEDAVVFMDTFRNTYPGIKKFIRETIDRCRVQGYVETISGRRRYLPHIKETNTTQRGQAERQAVNTTVQGSAADIAKKAMVEIEQELQATFGKTKNKPKLVLHLHDELMYEVPAKYVRKVARIVKKNMENSVQLSVPFPVKLKTGTSWGLMTEYDL